MVNARMSSAEARPAVIETVADASVLLSMSMTVSPLLIAAAAPFSV